MKSLIIIFSILTFTVKGFSQTPFISNFPPDVYKAATQNWAIVQDRRGVLFFGNNDGVLEYDGNTWRLIKTPTLVRCLAIDSNGRIYVGIRGDFGYLRPDSLGSYQYKSLKEKIQPTHLEFNDVWKIHASGNRVFFQSGEKIFVLQNEKFKVIYPKENFHLSFLANNKFYAHEQASGLMIYENDSLKLVEGGERFSNENIYEILPYKQNEILIVTRTQGLWIYDHLDKITYKPKGYEALDKLLLKHHAYCGIVLDDGSFAIGTLTGGIIVFNPQGHIQTVYNTEYGLHDNTILSLFSDNNHQFWACTNNGISYVQNNLPFQRFTEKNGLKGAPICIDFFNNHLYVGTSQYLFVQDSSGKFETITGTESYNWQLYQTNGTLLLANNYGLFEIKDKQAYPIITSTGFYSMCPLNNKSDYLLAGFSSSGLCLLEYHQKTWEIRNLVDGFTKPAQKIVQDKEGSFWVHTNPELYILKLNATMDSTISVMHCTVRQGLPTNDATPYRLNSGEVVFATVKGIYRYLNGSQTFKAHPDFTMLSGKIELFEQQKNGDIWFQEKTGTGIYETGLLKYSNGNYLLVKQPFYKFDNYLVFGYQNVLVHSDSTIFIGTVKGLLQYNPNQKVDYDLSYHTLIRNVFANESLLYGGTAANLSKFEDASVIPFNRNNLVFHYAATSYEDVEKNLYSYRLIGSDTSWSAWGSYVKKEYTNLSEGEYTFEVRAKNQYKVMGSTAQYSFRILPPLQRTWWAYTLYALFFTGLVIIIVKIYTSRLIAQKEHLEEVVRERTYELMQRKEELTKLNADKDRFITILAHDLKSPFNSILGFLGLLLENLRGHDIDLIENHLNIVNNSAKNTFNLLEDILIWVRASSGKIPYEPQKIALSTICTEVIESLILTANTKEISITCFSESEIVVFADKNMIKTVLRNLVSNSIKFTNRKGQIDIYAEKTNTDVLITISDNGVGIEPKTQKKLFDISQKISTVGTDDEKGTGLGLLLCREFVEKNGGRIWVESELGKGSEFKFTLPLCYD